MEKFYKKYNGTRIKDAGCYNSDEFKQFAKDLKATMKREGKPRNINVVDFSIGHYYVSGFLEKEGKYVYFSYYIPRGGYPVNLDTRSTDGFLIRTAEHIKDFRGGSNQRLFFLSS